MYSKKLFSKSHYYVGTEAYLPAHLEQGAIYIAIDTRTTWCYDLEQKPQKINPAAILTAEQTETLKHFKYNPDTDKLESDRSIETLLSSLYLGTAWKISSAGDAITFVTEEFNESYFPITYGFRDHENPAYQGADGYIAPKVANVGDLIDVEIYGPPNPLLGASTTYESSGVTTEDVFIFSIEIIIEQEIVPSDIILYEFFGGPDLSYPLIYEQRLKNLTLHPGDCLHMQFSNPLKQVAGSNISTRLAYAKDDDEITKNGGPIGLIKVRQSLSDPNQHYAKAQLRFYTEEPLITEDAVTTLVNDTISSQDFMRQSVYDLNNIGLDVFDMDSMIEGTSNKILTLLERNTITSNEDRLDIVEDDLDGKLEAVSTDSTLTGDGTILSPLSVVSTTEVKEGLYAVHSENTALTALTQNVWSQIVIAPTMHVIEGFTHDGAGTFTYTGSNPKKFVLEATISQVGKGDDKKCYFAWYINGISKPGIMAQDMHKSKYYGDVNPKTVTTLSNGDSCNVWMVNAENSDDTTIKYINITIHEF